MAGQLRIKSGKTFRYQATVGDLVGRGAYGNVFKGYFKSNTKTSWEGVLRKTKPAEIKRVLINFKKDKCVEIESDREVVALKKLRHPFIVTLYAVEDDNNFR
jgi:serine/threonine protein kinase